MIEYSHVKGSDVMNKNVKEYLYTTFGTILVAAGLYFFLIPSDLATGGASGLAIVINHFVPNLPISVLLLIINTILFITGFIIIGKGFGIKTIYASLLMSVVMFGFEQLVVLEGPLSNDLLLNLIFGILISAVGMGIVFNQDASTGGTDILAKIINKFTNLPLGRAIFLADLLVVISAGFAFGITKSLYAMLGVLMNGYVIDYIIDGLNVKKEVTIISSNNDEIKQYIMDTLDRGFTVYYGKGGYSNVDKEILVVITSKREYIKLRNFIHQVDNLAFLTVNTTHEVYGEGFTR